MFNKLKLAVVALGATLAMTTVAPAATVTYTNADATPQMQLTIDDGIAGTFRFTLTTLVGAADFLAVGFNLFGSTNPLTSASFSLVSATNASDQAISPALVLYGNDTGSQSSCGQGCNFNGAGSASLFDYILRIGSQGSSGDDFVKTVVFDLTYAGSLAENPFSQLAVRAQSTTNTAGSIKADMQISAVPLPAGAWLMLAGLGALAAVRRRKRA